MNKAFDWNRLGDVEAGRENLGNEMPVVVYRLLQYTMMDELSERFDKQTADDILRSAGFRAGVAFAKNMLGEPSDFDDFIACLQRALRELKMGILRIEQADLARMRFVLTVSEDLDCSGLPVTGETVCVYDEGFLAGVLQSYTGKTFDVREVDCWGTGERTCRFTIEAE